MEHNLNSAGGPLEHSRTLSGSELSRESSELYRGEGIEFCGGI